MYRSPHSFSWSKGRFFPENTDLVVETPLEITVNGECYGLVMFSPKMIEELVVGFIFTEGLICRFSEITECTISSQQIDGIKVIKAGVVIEPEDASLSVRKRKGISYASCGICGSEDYFELYRGLNRVKSRHRFSMDVLQELSSRLIDFQPVYKRTGGAHAAVLFDSTGDPVCYSEDMGRHNALDKVIGSVLMKEIPCHDKVLVSSGRASLEMILKAARAGFPVFVAMSRPTSRAVEAAKFYNITLLDLARDTNRIYSHARRIEGF